MLVGLQSVGAILPVRFSGLEVGKQKAINALSPRLLNNNSNVYFPCLGWAEKVLAADKPANQSKSGKINISDADRKRGSVKAASRKRRYAPKDSVPDVPDVATHPEHEEYLFLNAVCENGGLTGAPFFEQKGGLSGTRISTDNNLAADFATGHHREFADFSNPSSKAEHAESSLSSLPFNQNSTVQHGCSDGEASAPVPRAVPLARPEGTEYDAAGARANERRAS